MQAAQAQARADDERRRERDLRDQAVASRAVTRPPDTPVADSSPSTERMREATSPGTNPTITVTRIRIAAVNSAARASIPTSASRGMSPGANAFKTPRATAAGASPPAAPAAHSRPFGRELSRSTAGRPAHQTDRDLASARQGAQERHDRDVVARDQQDGRGGGHQRAERQEHAAELPLPQRVEADAASCLRGMGGGQIALEIAATPEIATRLRAAHAGAKTANRRQIVIGAIGGIARREIERQPCAMSDSG